jgi:hypothetical protein
MPDIEDPDEPDEPEWVPAPPPPDTWAKWEPRALQVFFLHAFAIGVALGLSLVGVVSQKTANWLLACQIPALTCAWAGLIAFLVVRSRERSGELLERGRTLVVGLDLFTAIFAVMGFGFLLAILAI